MIMCDEIIDMTKTVLIKAIIKKGTSTNFYILPALLLLAIALLIAVSICFYLLQYQAK